ncbi:transposase [Cohnella algarum]|uniref:transposase n=1 Tax=Cohnella algarum TaxID=2044859 RepID=UPI001967F5DE|nr:transposase [Cohnella algarum]MBN2981575.1 helix-turn-helix domain-containing protein [Cohnella algarum]
MISASDREHALTLIQEAVAAGAREAAACRELGLTQRTLQRWRKQGGTVDGRPHANRPTPANKLCISSSKNPKKNRAFFPIIIAGNFFTVLS